MDDELRDLLERAAATGATPVDPVALRRRVERRSRLRGTATMLAILLVAVPLLARAAAVDDEAGPDRVVLDDQPSSAPSSAPSSGSPDGVGQVPGAVPAAEDVGRPLDARIGVALEGPLAASLDLVVVEADGWQTAIGHPLVLSSAVTVTASTGSAASLPAAPGAGTPEVGWRATGGGLAVVLTPPQEVQVLAGGPAGSTGRVVSATEVPVWLPRTLHLQVESTDLLTSDATREVEVPFGDSVLRVLVTLGESSRPAGPTREPAAAAVGAVLEVPPLGEASAVLLDDGTPVWIANTRRDGVTVVDGRSPFTSDGITSLVRWCASAQGFDEDWGGSRFTPDGTYAFGPAPGGLVTYTVEPAGADRVRITSGRPGGLRPPPAEWPPGSDPDVAGDVDPVFAGPWCEEGPIRTGAAPAADDIPLDAFTPGDVEALPVDGRVAVTGRLVLDRATGRGQVCAVPEGAAAGDGSSSAGGGGGGGGAGAPVPGCADGAPVDLATAPASLPGDGQVVVDGTFVLTVRDGVVVEVWTEGVPSATYLTAEGRAPDSTYLVTRLHEVVRGEELQHVCPAAGPVACAAALDVEDLAISDGRDRVDPRGPLSADVRAALAAGRLPDTWVVVDEYFGDADVRRSLLLTDAEVLPDGTRIDAIPDDVLLVVELQGEAVVGLRPVSLG